LLEFTAAVIVAAIIPREETALLSFPAVASPKLVMALLPAANPV